MIEADSNRTIVSQRTQRYCKSSTRHSKTFKLNLKPLKERPPLLLNVKSLCVLYFYVMFNLDRLARKVSISSFNQKHFRFHH